MVSKATWLRPKRSTHRAATFATVVVLPTPVGPMKVNTPPESKVSMGSCTLTKVSTISVTRCSKAGVSPSFGRACTISAQSFGENPALISILTTSAWAGAFCCRLLQKFPARWDCSRFLTCAISSISLPISTEFADAAASALAAMVASSPLDLVGAWLPRLFVPSSCSGV